MKAKSRINPMVSIIIPTYNRADKIGTSIESVLAQTYPHFELIIVDDGSTDHTHQIVKAYQDERIRYYRQAENAGQAKARNYGIKMAQYEYLAFEDSDDLWLPQKLERQMKVFEHADDAVGMVYHKLRYDFGGGRGCILPDERLETEKKSGDIYAQLLWDNLVGMPTLLIKRACVEEIGLLDEEMKCLEDYDFVLRIAKRYHAVFLDEVLLHAQYSTTGVSGDSLQYLLASVTLISKYKNDYIKTGTLQHRIQIILEDAQKLGIQAQIVALLEKILLL